MNARSAGLQKWIRVGLLPLGKHLNGSCANFELSIPTNYTVRLFLKRDTRLIFLRKKKCLCHKFEPLNGNAFKINRKEDCSAGLQIILLLLLRRDHFLKATNS